MTKYRLGRKRRGREKAEKGTLGDRAEGEKESEFPPGRQVTY